MVYFGSYDNHIYAVDAETGGERWRFETGDSVHSSPAVADGVLYSGSRDGNLYAVNIQTGEEKWRFRTEGKVKSSPSVAGGVVYFGSYDRNLYAVDTQTGEELWRLETEGWSPPPRQLPMARSTSAAMTAIYTQCADLGIRTGLDGAGIGGKIHHRGGLVKANWPSPVHGHRYDAPRSTRRRV